MCPHKPQSCILGVFDFRADDKEVIPLIAQQMGLLCSSSCMSVRMLSAYLGIALT